MLTNTAEFNAVDSDREHIEIKPSVLYVGTPVVLITSLNPDGTTNISPMSSVWALYDRVVLGLTSTSKGRENLLRERQLVLNFPSPELWPKVEAIAPTTGRDPVPRIRKRSAIVSRPINSMWPASRRSPPSSCALCASPNVRSSSRRRWRRRILPAGIGPRSVPKASPSSRRRFFVSTRTRISSSPAPIISILADGARCFTCFGIISEPGRILAAPSRPRDDAFPGRRQPRNYIYLPVSAPPISSSRPASNRASWSLAR